MREGYLSVVGLGKLGACSAACFAAKGFNVLGMDINKNYVDLINRKKAPVLEPRLQDFIILAGERLKATQNYEDLILYSDITFLIIPTPSKPDGSFSDAYLKKALQGLSAALRKSNKKYHLFVVTSTVSPGTTDKSLIPVIEKFSGRIINNGFGVAYNPEFIALGDVINGFLNPDLLLIGQSDGFVGDQLEKIYKKTCGNKPYVARMSIISAEITKISLNAYVTMKISYANNLANICERVPGADIDDITKALGADKRISPFYLKGGPAFGGPCFPRDGRAFVSFARKNGVAAKLAEATDEVNRYQLEHLTKIVLNEVKQAKDKTVSVLGLAYKPKTPVIEESAAIKLIEGLLKYDIKVSVYDSLAIENTRVLFGDKIKYASSVKECVAVAPVCVITTLDKEFQTFGKTGFQNREMTVIDCWRILDPAKLGKKVKYIGWGRVKENAA